MKGFAALLSALRLASLQTGHAMTAPNWTVKKDVSYGSDQQENLDLYLLNKGRRNPVIILIHGGGWGTGDKSAEGANAARWGSQGAYRRVELSHSNSLLIKTSGTPLQDVQLAVRFLRANAANPGRAERGTSRVREAGELLRAYTPSRTR